MRTRNALLGVVVAGAVAAGVVMPALAQDDAATTEEQQTVTTRDGYRALHQERFAAALADELGLPETEVAEAIERVRTGFRAEARADRTEQLEERLDEAVEAGDLTREQADAILEAHEAGVMPFGRGGGHDGHGGRGGHGGLGGHGGGPRGPAMLDG
jgi:hypothetical protein